MILRGHRPGKVERPTGYVGMDIHSTGKNDHARSINRANTISLDLFDDLPVADADIPDLTIYIVGRIKYPAARYSQLAPRVLLIDILPAAFFMRRVPPCRKPAPKLASP